MIDPRNGAANSPKDVSPSSSILTDEYPEAISRLPRLKEQYFASDLNVPLDHFFELLPWSAHRIACCWFTISLFFEEILSRKPFPQSTSVNFSILSLKLLEMKIGSFSVQYSLAFRNRLRRYRFKSILVSTGISRQP